MSNFSIPGLPVNPGLQTGISGPSSAPGAGGAGFGDILQNAIEQVDTLHQDSQHQISELLQGDRQDIHNVMIAVEKADVAFQLMMQVRNKIVNAYQEISKMQF
ncbi:MAG TPA: flagellar hook-basal body complex protein FliE [Terriglobales bacterium]|nr:flagellar hook-basal body complex protein FliE [Terriglobales bacterium]